jgi:2Fe-2S ferredoxin
MPHVTYSLPDGSSRTVEIEAGVSVMQAAIQNGVPGIDAECGGCLDCATCHVYVDPAQFDQLPPPSDQELEMLEAVTAKRLPTSRLSCQLLLPAASVGLAVKIPEKQL